MSETPTEQTAAPDRKRWSAAAARCPLGGYAPCVDDLCHGGGRTLCGLEWGFDFCDHGNYPDACDECALDEDADGFSDGQEWWDE